MSARKWLYPSLAFIATFALHASYTIWDSLRILGRWAQTAQGNTGSLALSRYLQSMDYLLGIAYGLSAAFMVYAFLRLRENQRSGTAGLAGGATLIGALYFGGCFLIGCCGSPMLVIYLNLFGARFLGFTKPLVLGLTVVSIAVGYFWMDKRLRNTNCACPDGLCVGEEDK